MGASWSAVLMWQLNGDHYNTLLWLSSSMAEKMSAWLSTISPLVRAAFAWKQWRSEGT